MPLVPPRPVRAPVADPRRRRLLGAMLAAPVTIAGGLTGCTEDAGSPRKGRIELSVFWWGDQKRADLTGQALQLYSAQNPEVRFKVTWQGSTGYYDRLATQAAGGNIPDLFQIDDNNLTEYAERGILLDLTRNVQQNRLDLRGLPRSLVQYGQVDGRTVAVAAASNTAAMVYNRALVRRLGLPAPTIGMSYPELIGWAANLTRRSDGQVAGTMDPAADQKALWHWLRSQNKEFYRGRQLGFTAADLTGWFDLWQEARARRATPGAAVVQRANSSDVTRQLVVTGNAATSFMWSNQLPELQKYTRDELDLVSYPGDPAAQWARASMYWAGFRGTRHPELVVDVMNFLTNNVEVGRVLGTERGLNANLSVRRLVQETLTDPAMQRSAAFEIGMTDRFGGAPPPPPRGHAKVRALLVTAAEATQQGRLTSRAAATGFLRQADAALSS
ncbi:extracellular solute-binding protein [Micromonospora sp. CPCC 206060]|uniref:ABC transporter substrate-binding protein n=1 Tax=Micromonospora sp. CPCC 206060 TaxID=3122406 RepID=UPI002FF41BBC